MDNATAQLLIDLNTAFYAKVGTRFAQTRQSAWPGWERVVGSCTLSPGAAVLDVACGNLRFYEFLQEKSVGVVDGCAFGSDIAVGGSGGCTSCSNSPRFVEQPTGLFQSLRNSHEARLPLLSVRENEQEAHPSVALEESAGHRGEPQVPRTSRSSSVVGERDAQLPTASGEGARVRYCGVDAEPQLPAALGEGAQVERCTLLPVGAWRPRAQYDLVACFGFFHHIPGATARGDFLRLLASAVAPGGSLAVSLWRFAENEQLAAKARTATQAAFECFANAALEAGEPLRALNPSALEPGDWFLGWQDTRDIFRYCHSFSSAEVDALAAIAREEGLVLADRFEADGRTGDLNAYLVFTRPLT